MFLANIFNPWTELELTTDLERYSHIISVLEEARIPFKEQIQNMGHNTRRMGTLGVIGELQRYSTLYQVFVKKGDLQKAKYLTRRLSK